MRFHRWGNWYTGTTPSGYRWNAKVYDLPSRFGINDGRVSKLSIRDGQDGPEVYNYERGLDFDRLPHPSILAEALWCATDGEEEHVPSSTEDPSCKQTTASGNRCGGVDAHVPDCPSWWCHD